MNEYRIDYADFARILPGDFDFYIKNVLRSRRFDLSKPIDISYDYVNRQVVVQQKS
jgi:hypothetical protein